MSDFVDIERPGCVERRPVPERVPGHPVGYDDHDRPIYKPVWADYEWFAVWVDAKDLARLRAIHREHLAHLFRIPQHVLSMPVTSPAYIDWRDTLATSRDLMAAANQGALS